MNDQMEFDKDLPEIQTMEVEIMKKIHDICEKHNISYFLLAGTLLGAVRHGGFIPWDEDLDIGMFRTDYNKFLKVVQQELPDDYKLIDGSIDGRYSRIYGKVFALGTKYYESEWDSFVENSGLWIDIFPIDKIAANDITEAVEIAKKRNNIISNVSILRRYREHIDVDKMSAVTKTVCKCLSLISYKALYRIVHKGLSRDEKKDAKFCTNYGSGYGVVKQTMPIDYYLPVKKIKFADEEFLCPNKTEEVLKQIYKNYMELPPVEQRVMRHKLKKRM